MTPEQFQRITTLFDRVCDLDADVAAATAESEAGDDPLVLERVLAMIRADDRTVAGLDAPALGALHPIMAAPARTVPERIGRYRILELLGEGGMGRVYRAEQDAPQREVALKLMRPGLVSPRSLARFADESRFLARLQHPGIAQVHDAGTVEQDGVTIPYFAMELIEGVPLTDHVRDHDLGLRSRIGLVRDVASAAHHAHQRGIVHRDLKPDNILVDAEGRPRILDLGVARTVDPDPAATVRTVAGEMVGTLGCMSPEQLDGRTDVDSRADVYALGVILYEILAGRPPHDVRDLPLPAAIRHLAESRPTRLSEHDRRLRGDLETIVERAMELDPGDRYPSASEFAADLQRFLDSEPILARPPGTIRAARLFVRRHRALTVGVVTTGIALVGGIIGVTLSLGEARTEAERARRAQSVSEETNRFLNEDLLAAANPDALGRDVLMRDVVDVAADRLEGRFPDAPLVEAAIRATLGRTYQTLGDFEPAHAQTARALELRRRELGEDDPLTLTTMVLLGWIERDRSRFDAAETLFVAALDGRRRRLGTEHIDTLEVMNHLGSLYNESGRFVDAEPVFTEAVATAETVLGPDDIRFADLMNNLAVLKGQLGEHEEALALHRRTLDITRELLGPDHTSTLYSIQNVGLALSHLGRLEDAEPWLDDAAEGRARVLGPDHPFTLWTESRRAELAIGLGRPAEAERELRRIRARATEVLPADHWFHLAFVGIHAASLVALERPGEAADLLGPSVDQARDQLGPDHRLTASMQATLADARAAAPSPAAPPTPAAPATPADDDSPPLPAP